MIIDYNEKYSECVKTLLLELQEHIEMIDEEGYNIVGKNFKEEYFEKMMEDVGSADGKILLYVENDVAYGMCVGLINNEAEETFEFKAPKRGRISELIVSKNMRSNGIGKKLLNAMEKHLKSAGCEDVLLGVFAYNKNAINFYEKNGYHVRMLDMTKKI